MISAVKTANPAKVFIAAILLIEILSSVILSEFEKYS
jgi:hypothetical protein